MRPSWPPHAPVTLFRPPDPQNVPPSSLINNPTKGISKQQRTEASNNELTLAATVHKVTSSSSSPATTTSGQNQTIVNSANESSPQITSTHKKLDHSTEPNETSERFTISGQLGTVENGFPASVPPPKLQHHQPTAPQPPKVSSNFDPPNQISLNSSKQTVTPPHPLPVRSNDTKRLSPVTQTIQQLNNKFNHHHIQPSSVVDHNKVNPPLPHAVKPSFANTLRSIHEKSITPIEITPAKHTSKQGYPAIIFNRDDYMVKLASRCRYTLIGKFDSTMPKMETIRRSFELQVQLKGPVKITHFNSTHVYIDLSNQLDHDTVWFKEKIWIQGRPMKLFAWTPTFKPNQETPLAPIWVVLPELPWHMFYMEALSELLFSVGRAICLDTATFQKTRGSVAKVKLEIDVTKPRPSYLWVGFDEDENGDGFWQEVEYENVPEYCIHCKHQGHSISVCSKKKREDLMSNKVTQQEQPVQQVEKIQGQPNVPEKKINRGRPTPPNLQYVPVKHHTNNSQKAGTELEGQKDLSEFQEKLDPVGAQKSVPVDHANPFAALAVLEEHDTLNTQNQIMCDGTTVIAGLSPNVVHPDAATVIHPVTVTVSTTGSEEKAVEFLDRKIVDLCSKNGFEILSELDDVNHAPTDIIDNPSSKSFGVKKNEMITVIDAEKKSQAHAINDQPGSESRSSFAAKINLQDAVTDTKSHVVVPIDTLSSVQLSQGNALVLAQASSENVEGIKVHFLHEGIVPAAGHSQLSQLAQVAAETVPTPTLVPAIVQKDDRLQAQEHFNGSLAPQPTAKNDNAEKGKSSAVGDVAVVLHQLNEPDEIQCYNPVKQDATIEVESAIALIDSTATMKNINTSNFDVLAEKHTKAMGSTDAAVGARGCDSKPIATSVPDLIGKGEESTKAWVVRSFGRSPVPDQAASGIPSIVQNQQLLQNRATPKDRPTAPEYISENKSCTGSNKSRKKQRKKANSTANDGNKEEVTHYVQQQTEEEVRKAKIRAWQDAILAKSYAEIPTIESNIEPLNVLENKAADSIPSQESFDPAYAITMGTNNDANENDNGLAENLSPAQSGNQLIPTARLEVICKKASKALKEIGRGFYPVTQQTTLDHEGHDVPTYYLGDLFHDTQNDQTTPSKGDKSKWNLDAPLFIPNALRHQKTQVPVESVDSQDASALEFPTGPSDEVLLRRLDLHDIRGLLHRQNSPPQELPQKFSSPHPGIIEDGSEYEDEDEDSTAYNKMAEARYAGLSPRFEQACKPKLIKKKRRPLEPKKKEAAPKKPKRVQPTRSSKSRSSRRK